jgi:hypothetical protein
MLQKLINMICLWKKKGKLNAGFPFEGWQW